MILILKADLIGIIIIANSNIFCNKCHVVFDIVVKLFFLTIFFVCKLLLVRGILEVCAVPVLVLLHLLHSCLLFPYKLSDPLKEV